MTKLIGRRSVMLGTGAGMTALAPIARVAGQNRRRARRIRPGRRTGEDLMREHGVLRRILLVYAEVARRLEMPPAGDVVAPVQRSAS